MLPVSSYAAAVPQSCHGSDVAPWLSHRWDLSQAYADRACKISCRTYAWGPSLCVQLLLAIAMFHRLKYKCTFLVTGSTLLLHYWYLICEDGFIWVMNSMVRWVVLQWIAVMTLSLAACCCRPVLPASFMVGTHKAAAAISAQEVKLAACLVSWPAGQTWLANSRSVSMWYFNEVNKSSNNKFTAAESASGLNAVTGTHNAM